MPRTTKEERKKNAKWFYEKLSKEKKICVVIYKEPSNSNSVKLLCKLCDYMTPRVIAASPNLGIEGCFIELSTALNCCESVGYYEPGFADWIKEKFQMEITYNDGLVMIFEWRGQNDEN